MLRCRLALVFALALTATAQGQPPEPANPFMPSRTDLFEAPAESVATTAPRLWAEVDYLLWWMKPVCEPPATVSVGNPADAIPGAVGQPGTVTVMGKTRFEFPAASGIRPTVGVWLGEHQHWGLYASAIILPTVSNTRTFTTQPAGPPAYLNYVTPTGEKQAIPFAIPGLVQGSSSEEGRSGLWGVELNAIGQMRFATEPGWSARGGVILGGRYNLLQDEVLLKNTQRLLVPPFAEASGENRFVTKNQFGGPQFGFQMAAECGRCEFEFTQKLAVGTTRMECIISGNPLVSGSQLVPGSLPGPLLAMPTNVGRQITERVTLLPELNAKWRFRLREHVKLTLGYNFLYWNRIFCPGDLMDPQINLTQLPEFGPLTGTALPSRFFARTDYFAQGLELGLQVEY